MAITSPNLASKYAPKIDERFKTQSQALMGTNNDFSWTGVATVNVYSIPTAPMNDYNRTGTGDRYGTALNQTANVQTMKLNRDRSYTYIIDRGDRDERMMVNDAGKSLGRQVDEVIIPEYDAYVFGKQIEAATEHGNVDNTAVTAENAYQLFLAAKEHMGNHHVPARGLICYCTYKFVNLLKLNTAFTLASNRSKEQLDRDEIGECDGTKIVRVASDKLPSGASFLMVHPSATVAPKTLSEHKIHDNPPGISGWKVEGREIYDAFVLDNKAEAIFYQAGAAELRVLNVTTAEQGGKKAIVTVNPSELPTGNKLMYKLGAAKQEVTYDQDLGSAGYTALSGTAISYTSNKVITVVEVTSANRARSVGTAKLGKEV